MPSFLKFLKFFDLVNDPVNDPLNVLVNDPIKNTLNLQEKILLETLSKNSELKISELNILLGKSEKTIKRLIKSLISKI